MSAPPPGRTFTDVFIERPVLSLVISVVLLLLGAIAFFRLPVRETPELQPPTVTVTTTWPGADPALVETDVTERIEREVNGIQGIRSLTSTSREQVSTVTVEFTLDRDLEEAANDVRARVARARAKLPDDAEDPVVEKADADATPVLFLRVASDTKTLQELSELGSTTIRERLETVPGVSAVDIFGEQKFAIRVELDPTALAARHLALSDVEAALRQGNADVPAGRVEGDAIDLTLRLDAGVDSPEAFGGLVVSREGDAVVHLSDVARLRMGSENERTAARAEGVPAITVAVLPQAQANILDISDEVKRRLPALQADVPAGVTLELNYDRTEAVRSSIREVEETLLLGFVLVALVIFAFLRDVRSALVPVLAIPVSIIGTFLVLNLFGYSVNVFTLFGLVLAIGIVVDDAIVVLENVYRGLEHGKDPRTAAIEGTREIVFPVLATTVSLVVVFLPILFTGGPSGRLFLEFGTTVVASVALSAVVALTLTPMLCATLLRPIGKSGFLFRATEPLFQLQERVFATTFGWFARVWPLAYGVVGASLVLGALGFWWLPREFFPIEDRNVFFLRVQAPEGTSFPFMDARMAELESELMNAVPERKVMLTRVASGPGGVTAPTNTGQFSFPLVPHEERARSQQQIVAAVSAALGDVTAFQVVPIQFPTVGRGFQPPVQFVLRHPDFDKLAAELPKFLAEVRKIPGLKSVFEDLRLNRPEIGVALDREKAARLGVLPRDLGRSLQILSAGLELSQFSRHGRRYPVIVGLVREARSTPDALLALPIRASDGSMVPLRNLVTFSEHANASSRFRYDRIPSATISANLDGITLGEAITRIRAVADRELPEGFRAALAGESRDFEDANQALLFVFALAVVLVWLTLAAQFDSFVDPLAILVSVPIALSGALATMAMFGYALSFFAQVGLVLLVGLVTKNGILLVEMANVLREEQGLDRWAAAAGAAKIRFRPVLMTSISTVVGAVPIALGFTSASRAPLGVAVVSGMVVATVLTLYVTPVIHASLGTLLDRFRPRRSVVVAGTTGVVLLLWSTAAQAETLHEVFALARENSRDLAAEAARVTSADAAHDAVVGGLVPTITATGSVTYGRSQQTLALGTAGPIDTLTVRGVVPVLAAGTWSSVRAANLRRSLAGLSAEAAEERVLFEVGLAWVDRVASDRRVVALDGVLARSRRLLALAEARVEVGAAAPIEVTRAELQVARDEAAWVTARNTRDTAAWTLLDLVGLPLDRTLDVAMEPLPAPPDARIDRPDLDAALALSDAVRADRLTTLAAAVPTLQVVGTTGVLAIAGDDPLTIGTVGLEASAPLFAGTVRVQTARRLAADAAVAEAVGEDLARGVERAVVTADRTLGATQEAHAVTARARALAEREVALAEDRFASGASSNVEVVEAQGRLAEAVSAEVTAEAAVATATLSAWAARGRLRELADGAGRDG